MEIQKVSQREQFMFSSSPQTAIIREPKGLLNDGRQYEIDFRTGFATAIRGDRVSDSLRSACASLNRERTGGLVEAAQQTPSRESVSANVWTAAFTGRARERDVPILDLKKLGLSHDEDGFISSEFLIPLTSGAEAQPYLDSEENVVYKLFDLRGDGTLGKKLVFNFKAEGFEVDVTSANWIDTMEKLVILNNGGGLPTEIIGLASTGDYLIAKQPLAQPLVDFKVDREVATEEMRGVFPIGGGLRQHVFVSYIDGRSWLIGDLHDRNIMRDSIGRPTIVDALHGTISDRAMKQLPWLNEACRNSKIFRETGERPRDRFDDVDDDEL